jgi:hypothetical protein
MRKYRWQHVMKGLFVLFGKGSFVCSIQLGALVPKQASI